MQFHSAKVGSTTFEVPVHYKLVRPVGSGAYGVVVSAVDERTGRIVAIKKVTKAFENMTDAKRILREIKLLRMFRHDNIMSITDLFPPPHQKCPKDLTDLYIVSDLMDTDLYRIIYSKQDLSLDHVQYFIYQILRALKCMHSASVVHRDLKPSNLLMNSNCDLKICDLGLARGVVDVDVDREQELTEYVVTRWYRAPEIMLACREYDAAIDVWSVGCIFSELMERRALFPGDDYMDQLRRIVAVVGKPTAADLDFVTSPKAKDFILGLPATPKVDYQRRFPGVDPQALDLLDRMLCFHPRGRITVSEALRHPYLAPLHVPDDEPEAGFSFDCGYETARPLTRNALQDYVFGEISLFHPEIPVASSAAAAAAAAVSSSSSTMDTDDGLSTSSSAAHARRASAATSHPYHPPSVVTPTGGNPFEPSSALAAQAMAAHQRAAQAADSKGGDVNNMAVGDGIRRKYASPEGWQGGPVGFAEAKATAKNSSGGYGAKMAEDK